MIGDAELRRRLATTLAATIAHEPGIHQQSNGPGASQPVIRGMGGDRVVVLEDGHRTGDLYASAADHAVTVDPLTAERIEVLRGPASLLYGSSALGGVVNVIREDVPRSLPERVAGTASVQGETVNRGRTGGLVTHVPVGRVAIRGEVTARQAGDTRTPLGVLESTDLDGHNLGLGASVITGWGFLGASVRSSQLDYGVPGEFAGQQIPGAHEGGAEIETLRRSARVEAGHLSGFGPFSAVELTGSLTHYQHDEIEGHAEAGEAIVGTSFDQLAGGVELSLRHDHVNGLLASGAIGFQYRGKDLRVAGAWPGTRSAMEDRLSAFVYEEFTLSPLRVQAGLRYDWTRVDPHHTAPIVVGDREIPVRQRTFGSFSGSIATLYDLSRAWTLGVSVARAFRTPAIEELYSDGPHLADFSFDIGNPTLDPEVGLGADLFLRASLPRMYLEGSVFGNRVRNYIHYQATGEMDPRFRRFPVFEARGDDALFVGAEGRVQWEAARALVLDGSASLVRARREATDEPLPDIPPASAALRVRYDAERWFGHVGWEGFASQDRVPHPIPVPGEEALIRPQTPTPGASLFSAGIGLRWSDGDRLHTITVRADNLLDTEWRDHLSRIKDVAPQPGRNIQVLYRLNF